MSSITTNQGILHYEVYGRGRPVILLHGWLGSWGLWQETMTHLGQSFRTYALDFWGFGESGKEEPTFSVQDFVEMVYQFMERLGIDKAPLVGHSMGGTVSLMVAIQYPERVSQVVVIGSPIVGSSLAVLLKLSGYRTIAQSVFNSLWALRLGLKISGPLISNDPNFYNMMDRDISKTTLESFLLSISSLRETDLRPLLHKIKIPALGMYGDKDVIVDPDQWQPMESGIEECYIKRYEDAGHFIMLDKPQDFISTLHYFLDKGKLEDGINQPLESTIDNPQML